MPRDLDSDARHSQPQTSLPIPDVLLGPESAGLRSRLERSLLQEPLAIVAMDCRLPQAESIHDYWELLREGRSAITPFPESVLPKDRYYDSTKGVRGKSYTTKGGLIKRRQLDWSLLGMSKEEGADWDECHLIFAEVAAKAWKSIDSALNHSVGVYIGHSGGSRRASDLTCSTMAPEVVRILESIPQFQSLDRRTQNRIADAWLHRMQEGMPKRLAGGRPFVEASDAARLVADVCKLTGPRMVLDAACASSLVALALAAIDLQSGSIDAAIVGGASYNKVDSHILFSQAQSCSANESRPFDQAADGLIASEGYVALVIKTLRRAIEDGDTVRGVIRGIGIATDGRGKSLWAPRREGQFNAMERAYDCGISPADVQFVEAHATSTQVGDATETQALTDFFRKHHLQGTLPVGSVKSNIGHTLETAGLAGLLKTVLAMEHAEIPPTINLKNPSDEIDWADAPFYVPTSCIPWISPSGKKPRCGAVNAFGIGGLNVHVIVEQYSKSYHSRLIRELPKDSSASIAKSRSSREPIAIVGLGVILPGAQSDRELTELLRNPTSFVVPPPSGRCAGPAVSLESISGIPISTFDGGYLTDYSYDWKRHRVPPKQVSQANPLQFMLLDAAGQALESAETLLGTDGNQATSVIVGTIFGGEFAHQLQIGLRLHDLRASLSLSLDSAFGRGDDADQFVFKQSIVDAMEDKLLKLFPALLDETGSFTSSTLASRITKQFHLLGGAMAIDSGECSADAALHTAISMLRNHSSDAVLCAGGQRAMDFLSYEAIASRGPIGKDGLPCSVPGEGAVVVLLKRLSDAQRNGDQIRGIIKDVSLTHGTAADENDPLSAVRFTHHTITKKTGELRGTQGLVSLAACLCDSSIANGANVSIVSTAISGVQYCTSLSKGGVISSLTNNIRKAPNKISAAPATNVAPTKLSTASVSTNRLPQSGHSIFQNGWSRPSIAAVFPGQGAQHSEMFDAVRFRSDSAKQLLNQANKVLLSIGTTSLEDLARLACATNASPFNRIWPIQATILVADVAYAAAWTESGGGIDIVCGHSLGELAALVVAGAWSIEDALRFTLARAEAVRTTVQDDPDLRETGLLSIAAPMPKVATHLKSFARAVTVTHENSPSQCVVGGRTSDLVLFQQLLREHRVSSVILDVPAAFHTPLMSKSQLALTRAAHAASISPPRVPFLSTVTGRFVSDPDEIRRNLLDQLISPVVYQPAIHRLIKEGIRGFVELGPSSVLTRLNQAITSQSSFHGVSISSISFDDLISESQSIALWVTDIRDKAFEGNAPTVSSVASAGESSTADLVSAPGTRLETIILDATGGRRQRKREQSLRYSAVAHSSPELLTSKVDTDRSDGTSAIDAARKSFPVPPKEAASVPFDPPNRSTAELEAFIRDFIVEHTGYPAEMVQMDWHLEADLGIDSIKQAQLFGELRELFDIDLKVIAKTQIRTMRDIVEALSSAGGKREWLADPLTSEPLSKSESHSDKSHSDKSHSEWLDRDELADFMVDFVIDQTGYPRDMVAFDADLEADLGLDSIKMAQLFGELRGKIDLPSNLGSRKSLAATRSLNDILRLFGFDDRESRTPSSLAPNHEVSKAKQTPAVIEETHSLSSSVAEEFRIGKVNGALAGAAWGSENATPLQQWLVEQVDRLDGSLVSTQADLLMEPDIHLYDKNEWWHGVASGAQIAEESVTAWSDVLESLIDRSTMLSPQVHDSNVQDSFSKTFDSDRVTNRYRLTMIEDPIPLSAQHGSNGAKDEERRWNGAAIILGGNRLQKSLRSRLSKAGVPVYSVDVSQSKDAIVQELERIWKLQPVAHVFITTPHDRTAALKLNADQWKSRRETGMLGPFWFCQHWYKLLLENGLADKATLVAATRLGGSLGLEEPVVAPESGCIAGMLKAIFIEAWVSEIRKIAIRTIDFAEDDSPEMMVDSIFLELAFPSLTGEVSWAGGIRRKIQGHLEQFPVGKRKVKSTITRGGNWIFTGGGRGITALVAEELSAKYSLVAHLVGIASVPVVPEHWRNLSEQGTRDLQLSIMSQARKSDGPDSLNPLKAWQNVEKAIEIDETLRRLRARGIEAYYYSCDCAVPSDLQRVVQEIRAKSGPISGCLHGAGVGQDARFDRKRTDKVEQCLSAKFDGALALMRATKQDPVEFFIGFGSISGRFGANGHTDYSAANDGLAKLIDWYRGQRPEVHSTTFHWHAWGDVGMATKPATKLALEMIEMQFMPAHEGIAHVIAEIEANAPEREVLITDAQYYRTFFPSEGLPGNAGDNGNPTSREALVESEFKICFDPVKDIFLKEHCLSNRPLLPMVIGVEAIVEAAAIQGRWTPIQNGGPAFSIHGLHSKRGLRWFNEKPIEAKMRVTQTKRLQSFPIQHVELTADFHARDGALVDPNRVHFVGDVSIEPAEARLDWTFPALDQYIWKEAVYPSAGSEFYVGPAFKMLNRFALSDGKLFGKIFSPPLGHLAGVKRSGFHWRTPSAVLDSCLFATGILAWTQVRPSTSLPVSIEHLNFFRLPKFNEVVLLETRLVDQDEQSAWFDFCVWSADGTVCMEALSYRTMSLQSDLK